MGGLATLLLERTTVEATFVARHGRPIPNLGRQPRVDRGRSTEERVQTSRRRRSRSCRTHVGYGLPIGGVLATRDAVIHAVGVDIACRMKLTVLDLPRPHTVDRPEPPHPGHRARDTLWYGCVL